MTLLTSNFSLSTTSFALLVPIALLSLVALKQNFILGALFSYYRALSFYCFGGRYGKDEPRWLKDMPLRTRVHVYSLSLIFKMWHIPHYRNGTFQEDMVKNLRNVAIPGTGVPLSLLCRNRIGVVFTLVIAYPIIALAAAIYSTYVKEPRSRVIMHMNELFAEQLLAPRDWFSFWRLNCRLASLVANTSNAGGFALEDKWLFLDAARKADIPITPILEGVGDIVVKHRNEEGGMGVHFFSNVLDGGDYIIQSRVHNGAQLDGLLPDTAPLSTFRVVTASHVVAEGKPPKVSHLSCVFRAGRAGAATDHSSILFDVDCASGVLGHGTTNEHWYILGPRGIGAPWLSFKDVAVHPDDATKSVAGSRVTEVPAMLKLCKDAHAKLLPGVPVAGWDVALTDDGPILLECNLSCNFFRGTFDEVNYFRIVDEHLKVAAQTMTSM